MNDNVSLSIAQVESAEERVNGATRAAHAALAALDASYDEWITLQKAYQILTRNSERHYVPVIVAHPLGALLEEWGERLGFGMQRGEQTANKKTEKVPPPPPMPTKIGIVFDAMVAANLPGYRVKDIVGIIPEDAPLPITKEDVYRVLPKLLNKGKISRDGRGLYHVGAPSSVHERPSLIPDDEERAEPIFLAS